MNARHLKDLYQRAIDGFSGVATVPLLWDLKLNAIVNNESQDIVRMFNDAFNEVCGNPTVIDLYPEALRDRIDKFNAWADDNIMNHSRLAGAAQSQEECIG